MTQPGYTIVGTTDATSPIPIYHDVETVIRTLTITEGTWLLNGMACVETDVSAIITSFGIYFSDFAEQIQITGITCNLMPGKCYGQSMSRVIQVSVPTVIDFKVSMTYSAHGGNLTVDNVDNNDIRFTATYLGN